MYTILKINVIQPHGTYIKRIYYLFADHLSDQVWKPPCGLLPHSESIGYSQ